MPTKRSGKMRQGGKRGGSNRGRGSVKRPQGRKANK